MSEFAAAFGLDWKLLIIQALNFGALLAILTYFLYKPLMKLIDERQARIAEGVRMAEAASTRLAEAKAEGDSLVGTASREAEALVAAGRARADEKGSEILKAAEERAQRVLREADAAAEEAKRQAMQESSREIARAAMLAAEKILASK
jgi:F-type H+-transporting ATPase subunit b